MLDVNIFQHLRRKNNLTNKSDFGTVSIIGGNFGMHGALYLAGRACMLMGSGKVILASIDKSFTVDYIMPELMVNTPEYVLNHLDMFSVIVIGGGLSENGEAYELLSRFIHAPIINPIIFDADSLNIIAKQPDLHVKFQNMPNKIITPHPGEAAKLLNVDITYVNDNRETCARLLAKKYNAITLLKGYHSLICVDKELFMNDTGNATLSNAGQGDTLCGMIAAFIAQGLDSVSSLRCATYLHGLSAEDLGQQYAQGTANGILASEVVLNARKLLNKILYECPLQDLVSY